MTDKESSATLLKTAWLNVQITEVTVACRGIHALGMAQTCISRHVKKHFGDRRLVKYIPLIRGQTGKFKWSQLDYVMPLSVKDELGVTGSLKNGCKTLT